MTLSHTLKSRILALTGAIVFLGCSPYRPLDIANLSLPSECRPAKGFSLEWIDNAAGWARWLATDAMPEMGRSGPIATGVDFGTHGILVIRLAPRSAAGTRIALDASESTRQGTTAVVTVRVDGPIPGGRTAQMVTAPCLAVTMARAGIASIRIVDTAGTTLGTMDLPHPRP